MLLFEWVGGSNGSARNKKDTEILFEKGTVNFLNIIMALPFSCVCVCLEERNGWRSLKNPQRWSRCSIFFLSLSLSFFLSHLTFFWRPLPPLCASLTRPAQEENAQMEMSCAHRPLWVVALLKIFFFFFIFRRHSIFPFFFLDILLWKKIKSKFSLLFL